MSAPGAEPLCDKQKMTKCVNGKNTGQKENLHYVQNNYSERIIIIYLLTHFPVLYLWDNSVTLMLIQHIP